MTYRLWFLVVVVLLNACAVNRPQVNQPNPNQPIEDVPIDTDEPVFISDPPTVVTRNFTAGTWNVRQATAVTLGQPTHVFPINGNNAPKKIDAIFGLLDKFSVEIAAIQEVHSKSGAFPLVGQNDFTVLKGDAIVENANLGPEYCPVVYKESVFDCEEYGTGWASGGRKIHWVRCTFDSEKLKTPKRVFYFGCAHYGDSSAIRNLNIREFFNYLDGSKAPQAIKKPRIKKGTSPDAFIIGGDVNSYYHGSSRRLWQRSRKAWFDRNKRQDGTVRQDIHFVKSTPLVNAGGFTKIKRDGTVPGRKIIDDLWWSLNQGISYIGPKVIADVESLRDPVRYPVKHATKQSFLSTHWTLADHKLVYAEFRY